MYIFWLLLYVFPLPAIKHSVFLSSSFAPELIIGLGMYIFEKILFVFHIFTCMAGKYPKWLNNSLMMRIILGLCVSDSIPLRRSVFSGHWCCNWVGVEENYSACEANGIWYLYTYDRKSKPVIKTASFKMNLSALGVTQRGDIYIEAMCALKYLVPVVHICEGSNPK